MMTLMWRLITMSLNLKAGMPVAMMGMVVMLELRELLGVYGVPLPRRCLTPL